MNTQYVTQREAEAKWCPFVLFGVYGGKSDPSVNRHPEPSRTGLDKCLGSGCMAWEQDVSSASGTRGRCGRS